MCSHSSPGEVGTKIKKKIIIRRINSPEKLTIPKIYVGRYAGKRHVFKGCTSIRRVIDENNRRGKKKSIYKVFHAFPIHLWCALDVPDEGIKYDPRR